MNDRAVTTLTPPFSCPSILPFSFLAQTPQYHKMASEQSSTPLRHYFSRRSSRISTNDLPMEEGAVGHSSTFGVLYGIFFLTVPLAYIYILLILLREICFSFPESVYEPIQYYVPILARVVSTMEKSSTVVEVWCVIEALFYVAMKLQIMYLQRLDPLERSLMSAPMLTHDERQRLWDRMALCEADDPVGFISGWFFDQPLENISKHDMRDFMAWSMFEGRRLEHLTGEETNQLEEFVDEIEWRISLHLYGPQVMLGQERKMDQQDEETVSVLSDSGDFLNAPAVPLATKKGMPRPAQMFRFEEGAPFEQPNYFSNLYENFQQQYRSMVDSTDFHPMEDIRNFVAGKRQQIVEAEETAVAKASQMSVNAYHTLITPGSSMDKQLSAISHATTHQINDAWNSVKEMRGRLETAKFLSAQRKALLQQMKRYRSVLNRMRHSAVPSNQMAALMRKLTECSEAMERLESSARDAFVGATGYARKNILSQKEPQRYAKYSSDPLLGIATYPLGIHLLLYASTELALRLSMRKRGFTRLSIGSVAYYFHPGRSSDEDFVGNEVDDEDEGLPIFFVHGIGIGLLPYLPLVDGLLESGRPLVLPEIPYVMGLRPWQSPNAVLPPAAVTTIINTILAIHGFSKATFVGHSYGTSWVSYMCKYAPTAVAAAVFLDPICFCLHVPRLNKQFVYHRPDPGSISYLVRTDVIVNWTIQRSFPWQWIILFVEDMHVPYSVFLSENDALVPSAKIESYLKGKGAPVRDFDKVDRKHFESGDVTVTVFRGAGHGDWTVEPSVFVPRITESVEVLCQRATVPPGSK
jgi:pimeloyl-ACP methyl ester carboxylesterase